VALGICKSQAICSIAVDSQAKSSAQMTSAKKIALVIRACRRLEKSAALRKQVQIEPEMSQQSSDAENNSPTAQAEGTASEPLVVMTLNLQYFASYPEDLEAAAHKLRNALGGPNPPNVVCVQEGLACRDILRELGFKLVVCAGASGVAQSVREMVYHDGAALQACKGDIADRLLCNQLYVRTNSDWAVDEGGVEQISSDLQLSGGGGRVNGALAVRSMSWLKLRRVGVQGPATFVMCTHITGGRFEDQYFVQQLAEERRQQTLRCVDFFNSRRPGAHPEDLGILVGDFNATEEYVHDGPMHGYFKFGIAGSEGVKSDAMDAGISLEEDLESVFKTYMVSPFSALRDSGWTFAYGNEVGVTSAFGHLIDHMALSRPVRVLSSEVVFLTNQKVKGEPSDTDLVITDHNAVKVTFAI